MTFSLNPGIGLELLDANYVMHSPAVLLDLRGDWLPERIRSFNPSISVYSLTPRDILNARLSWEFRPLSYLYVVYNSAANDEGLIPDYSQRQLLIKFTYLLEL